MTKLTAEEFARKAHAGATRKGKDTPYVSHLVRAVAIVKELTDDPNIIAATWLHDVVEDTDVTIEEVRENFGDIIAEYVAAETEDKRGHVDEKGTWKVRKLEQLDKLRKHAVSMPKVVAIAIADKFATMNEMIEDYRTVGDALFDRFNAPYEELVWYYHEFGKVFDNSIYGNGAVVAHYHSMVNQMFPLIAERTLVLIKPDGITGGHIGDVIKRFEQHHYNIDKLKVVNATVEQLEDHYSHIKDEPFFKGIVEYMQETPMIAIVLSGTNVVEMSHKLAGATNPDNAAFGTIRGDFARQWDDGVIRNVVHTSDSIANAKHEIKIWFGDDDV